METMVSILTTAYNHAPYIAQTLESFLMQKTEFPFEIVIHDDASTDGTADIIRSYAEKYPEIIHPIFQTENQYSKGVDVYGFMLPLVRGKYIAQCEGDDYWCDERKLQKQVDYMEAHPECSYCFCNSYNVDLNSQVIKEVSPVDQSRVLSSREMIAKPEIYLATAGTLYRTKDSIDFPKEMLAGEAGDIPLRNFLMLRGNAYGFAERMVCYRVMVPGSCSDRYARELKKDPESIIRKNRAYLDFYEKFDEYTEGRYHQELLPNINEHLFLIYRLESNWKKLRKPPFRERLDRLPAKQKAILFTKYYLPWLVKGCRMMRYGKRGLEKKY